MLYQAIRTTKSDYMGFSWFEVFINGQSTGNSFNALSEDHAIRMQKQLKK